MLALPLLLTTVALSALPEALPSAAPAAPAAPGAAPSPEKRSPRLGLGVELQLGASYLDSALRNDETTFVRGANVTWDLGRRVGFEGLLLEASWLYTSRAGGTSAVSVDSHYHQLALTPLVGFPLLRGLLPYIKAGPAAIIESATLHVLGNDSTYSATRAGLVFGLGLRATLGLGSVALSGRIEAARALRGGFADTLLTGGAGLVF